MLVPAKTNPAIKEKGSKKYLIRANGTGSGKIIFILLAKVIALHVRFSMVEV